MNVSATRWPGGDERPRAVAVAKVSAVTPSANRGQVQAATTTAHLAFEEGEWSRVATRERSAALSRRAEFVEQRREEVPKMVGSEFWYPITLVAARRASWPGGSVAPGRRSSNTGRGVVGNLTRHAAALGLGRPCADAARSVDRPDAIRPVDRIADDTEEQTSDKRLAGWSHIAGHRTGRGFGRSPTAGTAERPVADVQSAPKNPVRPFCIRSRRMHLWHFEVLPEEAATTSPRRGLGILGCGQDCMGIDHS